MTFNELLKLISQNYAQYQPLLFRYIFNEQKLVKVFLHDKLSKFLTLDQKRETKTKFGNIVFNHSSMKKWGRT